MYIFPAVFLQELTHACSRPLSIYRTHYVYVASGPTGSLTFDDSEFTICFCTAHDFVLIHGFQLLNNNTKYLKTCVFVAFICHPVRVYPRVPIYRTACCATSPAGIAINWHSFWEGILSGNSSLCQQRRLLPLIDTN